jgi:hypothetical protein
MTRSKVRRGDELSPSQYPGSSARVMYLPNVYRVIVTVRQQSADT